MSRHHCPKIAQEVMCETGLHNSHWICMLGIGTTVCAWWKISQWDTRWMCVSEIKIPYQGDSREDFQQGNQVVSISQVLIQVCDVLPHLRERQGCKGRREGAGTDRKWTGRRKKREKEKKKLILHCSHPSVDICQADCPTADRPGDSGCLANRDEAPAVPSCLRCHDVALK